MAQRRAYVPILKRVLVARRQLAGFNIAIMRPKKMSLTVFHETVQLPALQMAMGTTEPLEWEHEPALGLRAKRTMEDGSVVYSPGENDHRYINFKIASAHRQKTTGRKPGAAKTVTTKGSDIGLMKKFRKLENPRPKGPKMPNRGFSKGHRPLRSRSGFK